jgi:hypothetical protein
MISFLFWNIHKNPATFTHVVGLATTYTVDIILLAECPGDLAPLLNGLNSLWRGTYHSPEIVVGKVRVLSRLPPGELTERFTKVGGDMTIWRLAAADPPFLLLAVVHLPAKSPVVDQTVQQARAAMIAREIAQIEDRERSRDTVLVGDLNMNPFEPGMVLATGLHAAMTKRLASKPDRLYKGARYRRFYNPMWGLFGDRTPGPPGTYYWKSPGIRSRYWSMLDQVLLRPSLVDRLRNLQILESDGYRPLVRHGVADKAYLSDHLPLLFQLDV